MPKVSVIIPVYNCEVFLQECIDSLCTQTLSEIEMVFVCDASPDNSLSILREAEKKDERIANLERLLGKREFELDWLSKKAKELGL